MSEVRADVANAFDNATGVVFHVEMPGRRVMAHIPTAILVELGAGQEPGDCVAFVRENEPTIQRLVNEAVANGWTGPLDLMM